VAAYYASTFEEGLTACGVLVKVREGRPIHVEGNGEDPHFQGKAPLRAVADLLGLYDPDRLRGPLVDERPSSWPEAMARVIPALKEAAGSKRPVLLLTHAVLSPSRRALIEDLQKVLPGLRHVAWEPAASDAEAAASRAAYGEWTVAKTHLDKADVILSLQADFLGTDSSAARAAREFSERRAAGRSPTEPSRLMSRLWVAEGPMSLTGASADHRLRVRPSQAARLCFALARALHEVHGVALPQGVSAGVLKPFDLDALAGELSLDAGLLRSLAADLTKAGKAALVLAGPALPPEAHVAACLINSMLGAEGSTVEAGQSPALASLAEFRGLLEEAARGTFAAAIFWGVNPSYAFPLPDLWKVAAAKIPLTIRIGLHDDETAKDCDVVLPENHWLESWGDFEAAAGLLTLRQPAIGALHDTRQAEDVLLEVARGLGAQAPQDYSSYLKGRWEKEIHGPHSLPSVSFEQFWSSALHDGVYRDGVYRDGVYLRPVPARGPREIKAAAVLDAVGKADGAKSAAGDLELVLVPGSGVHDGRHASNPWLQELPDPVTKVTWTNPVSVSVEDAERLRIRDGDVLRIEAGGSAVEAPAFVQPGQASGVITLALGYGRRTGKVAEGIGANAYPLADVSSAAPLLRLGLKVTPTGRQRPLPTTQEHHRMEGRDLARAWSLAEYEGKQKGRDGRGHDPEHEHVLHSLNSERKHSSPKWGMAIDLSACTGCSACVVACQSENNVPVVGPEQVLKGREMHWIRIDRYYEGDPRDPRVLHQPIPCQHCDDAPCEIVCPVNATTHSPDGLNQMTYNRCVGTRYCANNCPYKVRRFNFLDFTSTKREPETLAFNPEVTVRPRGVMEKCTFCVQRIEDGKGRARAEGRSIKDGEIQPACAVACPTRAIVFGDIADPESAVSKASAGDRGYRLLEEFGIRPSVTYLARLTNPAGKEGGT
jgi:molybdopterin-containing oxidoreductase family iron-sulfur binding subunit